MRMSSILLALLGVSSAAQAAPRGLQPVDAIQGIVATFRQHPVVIIEKAHWLCQAGDFYIRLVGDPKLQETVQDIVVEFASRNNQPNPRSVILRSERHGLVSCYGA
jgi:hypothetical protein